ncbi:Myb-like DNA-binding domain containing protein [Trichomonas vaginalis G3]|uniref:Myb-like DNA-binding domain containing protein n=1 Tax=Trichomonas vaginalis (strain ATCC PRA-98 / G3) TaxID=412133 RepID=A2F834_TRIV3|nr:RNA polymerase II transcription regulator recruiting protein [Trichomonas vaginalis G3]EAX98910.1 Myb-like DNA-binding domain containing protein [Trichomonas vaginalis G3]KAI5526714.1 RNA polymerase II transcription regulator recruiting protein [Trichomonas vaginalis G3]|eukprot:XP_001311840.1 Myb-like DNA-binding domain containing protein [Trichomonas vaginalis G3]
MLQEASIELVTRFILAQFPQVNCENLDYNSHLGTSISNFLRLRSNYDEVAQLAQSLTGTTEPIKRLKKILETCTKVGSSNVKDPLPGKKTRPWTQMEDNRLIAGILKYGIDAWSSISDFVGNGRSRPQCAQRWARALDPKISKDDWAEEENEKLLKLIEKYGEKKWTQISLEMGNRTDVQCRYRYKQLKRKTVGSIKLSRQSEPAVSKSELLASWNFVPTATFFGHAAETQNLSPISFPSEKPPIIDMAPTNSVQMNARFAFGDITPENFFDFEESEFSSPFEAGIFTVY